MCGTGYYSVCDCVVNITDCSNVIHASKGRISEHVKALEYATAKVCNVLLWSSPYTAIKRSANKPHHRMSEIFQLISIGVSCRRCTDFHFSPTLVSLEVIASRLAPFWSRDLATDAIRRRTRHHGVTVISLLKRLLDICLILRRGGLTIRLTAWTAAYRAREF